MIDFHLSLLAQGVRIHDASPEQNRFLTKFDHQSAALDAVFAEDDSRCFSVGLDKQVLMHDVATGASNTLGSHEKAARCVEYSPELSLVVSGSWDKSVQLWDPRASTGTGSNCVSHCAQPGKVFALALSGHRLVVCTSERHVNVYDIRNTAQPEQRRVSSLRHQTRAVRIAPDQNSALCLSEFRGVCDHPALCPWLSPTATISFNVHTQASSCRRSRAASPSSTST